MTDSSRSTSVAERERAAMRLATTDRHRRHVRFLLAIENMTEADLGAAVAACPAGVRERLAQGPRAYRYACGVCEAFGRPFYANGDADPEDPMWRAWAYHEIPKLDMRVADDQHYGPLSNDNYRRTIATYRAAGWEGEAADPNA